MILEVRASKPRMAEWALSASLLAGQRCQWVRQIRTLAYPVPLCLSMGQQDS